MFTSLFVVVVPLNISQLPYILASELSEEVSNNKEESQVSYQPKIGIFVEGKEVLESSVFYKEVELSIQVEDLDMSQESSYILLNNEKQEVKWNLGKKDCSTNLKLSKSGDYHITYHIEGKDGLLFDKMDEKVIQLDIDDPTILIKMNDDKISDSFSSFYKDKQKLSIQVKDINLDLKKSKCYVNDEETVLAYDEIKKVYYVSKELSDGEYNVSYMLIDNGNHKIEKTFSTFIVDTIAPIVKIESNHSKPFENKDINFEIAIEDKNITAENIYFSHNGLDKDGIQKLPWTKKDENLYATYKAKRDGDYLIHLEVIDRAGNIANYIVQDNVLKEWSDIAFTIDTKAPIISIEHEVPTYISKHQVITINLNDEHMAIDDLKLKWQRDGNDISLVPSVKTEQKLEYKVKVDGLYQFTFDGQDKAGNRLLYKFHDQFVKDMKDTFMVDARLPYIALENITKKAITSEDIAINMKIQDQNLSSYQIFIKRNGKDVFNPWQQGTSNLDTRFSFHEEKQQEGAYVLYAQAIDKAGNRYESAPISFIIDRVDYDVTAVINQMPLKDTLIYHSNREVTLDINWKDSNPGKEIIELRKNGIIQDITVSNNQLHILEVAENNKENKYELSMKFIDQVGNMIERKGTFIIDQQIPIPTIHNDIFNNLPVSKSWTPHLQEENKQYRVIDCQLLKNQKVTSYEWGNPIVEDGQYALDVLVQDEALNQARFISPMYFEIDRTPTKFSLVSVVTKEELTSSTNQKDISLQLISSGLSKDQLLELTVNQKELKINASDKQFSIELTEGNNKIYAKAKDKAGNIAEKTWNIKFVQDKGTKGIQIEGFPMNYMLATITVLLLISGSIFYVSKRR